MSVWQLARLLEDMRELCERADRLCKALRATETPVRELPGVSV